MQVVVTNAEEFPGDGEAYTFDFGDGIVETTEYPAIIHDYTNSMGRDDERATFDVTVTVTDGQVAPVSVTRTLSVVNTYAFLKGRDNLTTPVDIGEGVMSSEGATWSATMVIGNREDTLLTLHEKRVHAVPCDGEGQVTYLPVESVSIAVDPGDTETVQIEVAAGSLPEGTCSLDVHFLGSTTAGQNTHAGASFVLPSFDDPVPVPAALKDLLNHVVDRGLVPDEDSVTFEQLQLLHRQRRIPESLMNEQFFQDEEPEADQPCDPDAPGEPPREGYACLPTDDFTEELQDYIANARRGDLLLVRSCKMVNAIFSQLDPVQTFTHIGFMSKHRSEVRESTGESDRLFEYPNGIAGEPTDGFDEEALKFFWPGTITSSVREAFVTGKAEQDPVGDTFTLRESFYRYPAQCPDDNAVVFPMILTASPGMREATDAGRNAAVDQANLIDGHYRFGSYSIGDMMNDLDEEMNPWPDAPGHARPNGGRQPTVCSGLVRQALIEAELPADVDRDLPIESDDRGPAAENEGLYFYDEGERKAAAENLFRWNQEQVARSLAQFKILGTTSPLYGFTLNLFTDIMNDVPNQFVNCFTSDSCSTSDKDHKDWKEPGSGFGVSPDNVLNHYDAAEQGGLYGFVEPMIYRHQRFRRIYTWQPGEGTHAIEGDVLLEGAPVEGAIVEVVGLDDIDTTDVDGAFLFEGIPGNVVTLTAQKTIEGELKERTGCFAVADADMWVEVDCGNFSRTKGEPSERVVLDLAGPDQAYRRVVFTGRLRLEDCDCSPNADDVNTDNVRGYCDVGPENPVADMQWSSFRGQDETTGEHCSDEVGYRLKAECVLEESGQVTVPGTGKLYEAKNNSCGGDDHEDTVNFSETVPANSTRSVYFPAAYNNAVCATIALGIPNDCDDVGRWWDPPEIENGVVP